MRYIAGRWPVDSCAVGRTRQPAVIQVADHPSMRPGIELLLLGEGLRVDPGTAIVLHLAPHDPDGVMSRLSPREYQILGLLSEGLTGQAIALRLVLSPETVRTHVRNATTKLGAKTRVQAVALLVRSRGSGAVPAPA
jgi:DNA-binding CsgD family transcriptional regulator